MSTDKRIDFIVVGAQKAGTTTLDAYLRQHPNIQMGAQKEVKFFDNDKIYSKGKPDLNYYHSFFDFKEPDIQLFGETTPTYMYWYPTPIRMWAYNPNLKLIFVLRNPYELSYSHWNMTRLRNKEELSFLEAIQQEEARRFKALPYQTRLYSYIDRALYIDQIRRIWNFFPKENTFFIKSESLWQDPAAELNPLFKFLQLDEFDEIEYTKLYTSKYETEMTEEEFNYLTPIFKPEIAHLESLLGWDCSDWLVRKS